MIRREFMADHDQADVLLDELIELAEGMHTISWKVEGLYGNNSEMLKAQELRSSLLSIKIEMDSLKNEFLRIDHMNEEYIPTPERW